MKIVCQKNELLNGVNIALKAIPAKTTMPILECIVIEVSEAGIKLTSNDMDLVLRPSLPVILLKTV